MAGGGAVGGAPDTVKRDVEKKKRGFVSCSAKTPKFSHTMPFTVKQYTITLPAAKRGCHLITKFVREGAPGLASCRAGLAHVFIQHTSASLTVNENADPDVRVDMETFLNLTVPEGPTAPWIHTDEGEVERKGGEKTRG